MKRLIRFIVVLTAPPVLGLLVTALFIEVFGELGQTSSFSFREFADELPELIFLASVFTVIPSLVIFAIYEWVLIKRLSSVTGYLISGALFGFLSAVFILYEINKQIWVVHPVSLTGAIVGLVVGSLVYLLSKPKASE